MLEPRTYIHAFSANFKSPLAPPPYFPTFSPSGQVFCPLSPVMQRLRKYLTSGKKRSVALKYESKLIHVNFSKETVRMHNQIVDIGNFLFIGALKVIKNEW